MKPSALLVFALGAPLIFTNCATIGPPQPPSLDLPKPPQDLRAMRKGNRVTLTWTVPNTTTDRQTIRVVGPTQICRSIDSHLKQCGTPVGQAPPTHSIANNTTGPKVPASFTDMLPSEIESTQPPGFVTYAVEVLSPKDRGAGLSNQVRVLLAPTLPPPSGFQARVTNQGIVLSWEKITTPEQLARNLHFIIRVYRRDDASHEERVVGEAEIEGEPTLTDSNIEWEQTYEYYAETVTIVREPEGNEEQIEGDNTPEVKVFAQDVFPPAVPSSVQAVFSGPGQRPFVDLVWAPVTDPDLAGYNVYRHEEGTAPVKLNQDPLKTPAYRDTQVMPGKQYFYSVTSVDMRGNESAKSQEASETVP